MIRFNLVLFVLSLWGCAASPNDSNDELILAESDSVKSDTLVMPMFCNDEISVGAARMELYLDSLQGLRVGVVGNQSSLVDGVHLVDTLLSKGINVSTIFSPEHGFRGKADAGEKINNEVDEKTGIPIISLYGKNRKPKSEQLNNVDVLLFDIQDVGVRFYTYISTLHNVMEAAAENNKKVIVLDRPNPNGHYVDGPVLEMKYTSFVGMHKVPVVHGMTIGEYARLINEEEWLANNEKCNLNVIACDGWNHDKFYELPIPPSPNLPNMTAVYLYPSLCFFEGTVVSIGRGTEHPFQIVGHPEYNSAALGEAFSFVPTPNEGAKHPKLENEKCNGIDLHEKDLIELREKEKIDLSYLIEFYAELGLGEKFFLETNFINLLAGNGTLKKQIIAEIDLTEIRKSWEPELEEFKLLRNKYLLYSDN